MTQCVLDGSFASQAHFERSYRYTDEGCDALGLGK
jgi:hypothetical protein